MGSSQSKNDENNGEKFFRYCESNRVSSIKKLFLKHPNEIVFMCNYKDPKFGRNGFHIAAKCNHVSVIQLLLDTGCIDVNEKDHFYGQSALHIASVYQHPKVILELIKSSTLHLLQLDNHYGKTSLEICRLKYTQNKCKSGISCIRALEDALVLRQDHVLYCSDTILSYLINIYAFKSWKRTFCMVYPTTKKEYLELAFYDLNVQGNDRDYTKGVLPLYRFWYTFDQFFENHRNNLTQSDYEGNKVCMMTLTGFEKCDKSSIDQHTLQLPKHDKLHIAFQHEFLAESWLQYFHIAKSHPAYNDTKDVPRLTSPFLPSAPERSLQDDLYGDYFNTLDHFSSDINHDTYKKNCQLHLEETTKTSVFTTSPIQKAPKDSNVAAIVSECNICFTNPPNGVAVPCGHNATCVSCLESIMKRSKKCPICRTTMTQAIRLYRN